MSPRQLFILVLSLSLSACSSDFGRDSSSSLQVAPQISGLAQSVPASLPPSPTNEQLLVPMDSATVQLLQVIINDDSDPMNTDAVVATGEIIAETSTDASGVFTLNIPNGFVPSSNHVLRVKKDSEQLDTFVTRVDGGYLVDPVSHAAVEMLVSQFKASGISLNTVDKGIIENFMDRTRQLSLSTDYINETGLTPPSNTASYISQVKTVVQNDEVLYSIYNNLLAECLISGTVTDAAGIGLVYIEIQARNVSRYLLEAVTKTDSDGNYCLRVASGNYLLGAINNEDDSFGATAWFTNSGTTPSYLHANTVSAALIGDPPAPQLVDFSLAAGARLSGKIVGKNISDGTETGLRDVDVVVLKPRTYEFVSQTRTNHKGNYVLNLTPGDYLVVARNRTLARFGGEVYNSNTDGALTYNGAEMLSLAADQDSNANFDLQAGERIYGRITLGGNPVVATEVSLREQTVRDPQVKLLSNRDGRYAITALKQNTYVYAYGHYQLVDLHNVVDHASTNVSFTSTTYVHNATASYNSSPITDALIRVYQAPNHATDPLGLVFEARTNQQGTAKLFAEFDANGHRVSTTVDDGSTIASIIPTTVQFQSITADSYQPLAAGAELSGTVTVGGAPAPGVEVLLYNVGGNTECSASVACTASAAPIFKLLTDRNGQYRISLNEINNVGVVARNPGVDGSTFAYSGTNLWPTQASIDLAVAAVSPLGVHAEALDPEISPETITVHWKPAVAAASYRLYMSDAAIASADVSGFTTSASNMIHDTVDTFYEHSGLTACTTYYFRVTAVDGNGVETDTLASAQVQATAPQLGGCP